MTENVTKIYAEVALKFLEWGVSPLPLEEYKADAPVCPNPKKPKFNNWQANCRQLITEKRVLEYCRNHPSTNIGIALGAKILQDMQIAAIDIDDDRLIPLVKAVIGKDVCAKVGSKGKTTFVVAPESLKPCKLKLKGDAKPCIEFLANGNQTVMPPSIHPATGKPYYYIGDGKALYEYAPENLPQLSEQSLKLLTTIVLSEFALEILNSVTGTHDSTLRLTGQLVAAGFTKDEIMQTVPALFCSNYAGNSIDELPGMIDDAFKHGFHNASKARADDARVAHMIIADEQQIISTGPKDFLKYSEGIWFPLDYTMLENKTIKYIDSELADCDVVAPMIKHVLKCLHLFTYQSKFGDKYLPLVCCRNGTVNILTGELNSHAPEHYLRYKVDIDYIEDATCEHYDSHVRRTFMEDEKAIALWDEFCGYSFVASNKFQKALYLLGEGGSGKSTLFSVLASLHDPAAVSYTPLTKIDNERHITDIADKLLCISSDIQPKDNARAYGEAFVRITGSDPVTTRRLYQEVKGNVKATVRFTGSMNRMPPKFISAPDALKRRLIFLPCGSKIHQPDPDFGEKLMAERAGILTRWIKAYQRLEARGHFDIPESSLKLVDEYLGSQHPVQMFMEEKLIVDPNADTPISKIYACFREWVEKNGEMKIGKSEFGRKLQEFGLKQRFKKLKQEPPLNTLVNTRVYNAQIIDGGEPY
jgi:P4 family phage/plasmid primase-like protien